MLNLRAPKDIQLQEDEYILLSKDTIYGFEGRTLLLDVDFSANIPVGSFIQTEGGGSCLQVTQFMWLPGSGGTATPAFWARSTRACHFGKQKQYCLVLQNGYSLARITLSEKGFSGQRKDRSGPAISDLIGAYLPISWEQGYLLPDVENDLTGLLSNLSREQCFDLILTTGSTGITSRDIAPEATQRVIERRLPGFEQQMTRASVSETIHGIISRAVAGIVNRSLIINLPGSPAAVETNLTAVLPALKHTLDKLQDDPTECANQ